MKTLTEYLAEYIEQEVIVCLPQDNRISALNIHQIYEIVEQGIEAYQSTENCTLTVTENPEFCRELEENSQNIGG